MNKLPAIKVISGGQTGADQGGLAAAAKLGVPTGGTAPAGFKTETGNNPELLRDVYGLKQSRSTDYRPRTYDNCEDSDITIWFGNVDTPGYWCTVRGCAIGNCTFVSLLDPCRTNGTEFRYLVDNIKNLLRIRSKVVINVAGNRESGNVGIGDITTNYITTLLQEFM